MNVRRSWWWLKERLWAAAAIGALVGVVTTAIVASGSGPDPLVLRPAPVVRPIPAVPSDAPVPGPTSGPNG